ncbi:hypothetical protein [Synechococcus sp. BSF8S]|uniref:hypothetical protein n=1 Tax=Synechococcales TaxID=1890424 RepID=UPI00351C8972
MFREHRGFHGSPRIHQELRAAGHPIGRHHHRDHSQLAVPGGVDRPVQPPGCRLEAGSADRCSPWSSRPFTGLWAIVRCNRSSCSCIRIRASPEPG